MAWEAQRLGDPDRAVLARAITLDRSLKDRRRELVIDGSVYRTALDLSKPLPAKWSLAQTQRTAPVASVGLLAAVMLGVGLVRASGDRGVELVRQWLEPIADWINQFRGPKWLQRVGVGMAVTVLAFLFTYLRQAASVTEVAAYALGVALIGGIALYSRVVVAARREVAVTQRAWPLGMALGFGLVGFLVAIIIAGVLRMDGRVLEERLLVKRDNRQVLPLADVHLPPAPALWPPAPGWWLVLAVIVATTLALWLWRRRVRRRRAVMEALFDDTLAGIDGASARIATMSELLRRAARRRDPQADRLSGDAWLRFLDAGLRMPVFSAGAGRTLLEGGFRREVGAQEFEALRGIVRTRFVELMTHKPLMKHGLARRWPWSRRRT